MIVHIARHGQPALEGLPPDANPELPPKDYPLSLLGRRQARRLGEYLKGQGFRGKIISSPYVRTAETANIAADVCGVEVFFEPRIQEMRFHPEPVCPGLTLAELRQNFPHVSPAAVLAYPWMQPGGIETPEDVSVRVADFLAEFLANLPGEDVLLVGHGASVVRLMRGLAERAHFAEEMGPVWNCAVCSFAAEPDGAVRLLEPLHTRFLPPEDVTSNLRRPGDPL